MTFYRLDTQFTFGKFKGKTLRDALNIHPLYLEWCLLYVDHFYLSDDTLEAIRQIKPNFSISEVANQKRIDRYQLWEYDQEPEYTNDSFNDDNADYYGRYTKDGLERGIGTMIQ